MGQQGKVTYFTKFSFGLPLTTETYLWFDTEKSLCIQKHFVKNEVDLYDSNTPVIVVPENSEGFVYYKSYNSQEMTLKTAFMKDEFIVTDSLPKIKWKIFNDTKKIGQLNCQKAVGEFRGRMYTVWFTNRFPISAGPWKLHGLPGLILEAQDEKGEVQFLFKSIEYPLKEKIEVKPPTGVPDMSFELYRKYSEDIEEYIMKKIMTKMPRGITAKFNGPKKKQNLLEKF